MLFAQRVIPSFANFVRVACITDVSGIIGELEKAGKFKCANQQTDIAEDCLGTELNGQSVGGILVMKQQLERV